MPLLFFNTTLAKTVIDFIFVTIDAANIMFRRITGFIIILSLFLVKGASLFVVEYENINVAQNFTQEQNAKDLPEESKETKSFEVMDDSIACQQLVAPMPLALFNLQNSKSFPRVTTVYLTLLNPPPNWVNSDIA